MENTGFKIEFRIFILYIYQMKKIMKEKNQVVPDEVLSKEFLSQFKTEADVSRFLNQLHAQVLEKMLEGEMDAHLGYEKNSVAGNNTGNSRNGSYPKKIQTGHGESVISIPRDRNGQFEPIAVPKHESRGLSIEKLVISLYAKGMSVSDIEEEMREIYEIELSTSAISIITNKVSQAAQEWQNRPLKKFYTFLFVDCLYVTIRKDYETKNYAVYVILGYDVDGQKDILGLWLSESESKHQWMQIFDEIKNRGVEDVLFLSMDGVSGLEEGAKAIFPNVAVQRCIVHLIRNAIKYVPNKDYKRFTAQLKKVYGAASLKAAESEFERFKQAWSQYPGAVDVWVRNWQHVAQLFRYGSAVRKILYTTNAVESVNASFRKVTKKGAFPNENALLKLLYLRVTELYKKWNGRPLNNWALVRNQLDMDENLQERIRKYENGGF